MAGPGAVNIPIEVLLIEDSPGDVRLMEESFRDVNKSLRLSFASDGAEAMAFLKREGAQANAPRPDLILLDLNLPKIDGRVVLENIKADPSLRQIPLIVLTTSDVEADVIRCYELQANCYIHKPKNWDMFHRMIRSINDFWLTEVTLLRRDNAALLAQSASAALHVEH